MSRLQASSDLGRQRQHGDGGDGDGALFFFFCFSPIPTMAEAQQDDNSGEENLNITFVHPDLGIGGAENLIINAAIALQNKGHAVRIFTSHHSLDHCFEETKGDGK